VVFFKKKSSYNTLLRGNRYLHTQIPRLVPVLQSVVEEEGKDSDSGSAKKPATSGTDWFDATREHVCRAVLMAVGGHDADDEVVHLARAQTALHACQHTLAIGLFYREREIAFFVSFIDVIFFTVKAREEQCAHADLLSAYTTWLDGVLSLRKTLVWVACFGFLFHSK
jgi:hypothetical protein